MTSYLFSVVVPSHNRPEFLRRVVTALEKQELSKDQFELIIILSPDDLSFEWLNDYKTDLNLKFLTPEEDIWQGRNVSFKRNYGASIAQSQWIAFTDDDCVPSAQWLSSAQPHIDKEQVGGIEGMTQIPADSKKTITWKGAQRLSHFGGYQTCNMFYRKDLFLQMGGFDSENFPWFLEDTDMAWSVLGTGKEIWPEPKAIVVHPIGPVVSWRLIHEANRAGLKVKLFKKHPRIYFEKNMKSLRKPHYLYLALYALILLLLLLGQINGAAMTAVILLLFLAAHMFKQFRGLETSLTEVYQVAWRTLLWPILALKSILIEACKSRIGLKNFIRILAP